MKQIAMMRRLKISLIGADIEAFDAGYFMLWQVMSSSGLLFQIISVACALTRLPSL